MTPIETVLMLFLCVGFGTVGYAIGVVIGHAICWMLDL